MYQKEQVHSDVREVTPSFVFSIRKLYFIRENQKEKQYLGDSHYVYYTFTSVHLDEQLALAAATRRFETSCDAYRVSQV